MFFIKKFKSYNNVNRYARREISNELMRLYKLENGVKNYSGGIYSLHERVNAALLNKNQKNQAIESLLKDVSNYLRDLKIAGQLDRDSVYHSNKKNNNNNKIRENT